MCEKQVFEINVGKKNGFWSSKVVGEDIHADGYDETEVRKSIVKQLKKLTGMDEKTHTARTKRKWYITIRPKTPPKKDLDNTYDSDDFTGISLFDDI